MNNKYCCACLLVLSPFAHAVEASSAGALRFQGVVTDPSCQITPATLRVEGQRPSLPLELLACRTPVSASLGTATQTDRYVKARVIRSAARLALPLPTVAQDTLMLTLDYF